MALKEITREDILKTIDHIKKNNIQLKPADKYFVEINNEEFPIKDLLRQTNLFIYNSEEPVEKSGKIQYDRFLKNMEGLNYIEKEVSSNDKSDFNFKKFIQSFESHLEEDDKTYNLFQFLKITKNYAWIGDREKIIGELAAHYEILYGEIPNSIVVDIHFEDKFLNKKETFKSITDNLAPKCEKLVNWYGGTSIRYKNGIPINHKTLFEETKSQLLFLENTFGEKIREILRYNSINQMNNIENKQPLNQILFGPPGTGKTFNTINKAIQIVDGLTELELNKKYPTRKDIKEAFDKLLITDFKNPTGQIAFATFHQSMSYEDFIEGIKPETTDEKKVFYEVKKGIFRQISEIAQKKAVKASNFTESILKTFE